MDAQAYLAERGRLVDAELERVVPRADEPPLRLHAAMRHLLFPGGKRLRPALAFAGAEAVGAPPERALPVAAAVELVHTYSLVHDDLPCMDDDDERRGRPTVHVAFGEATAVLAGDALLALAFERLAAGGDGVGADRLLAALADLARAAGSRALVGGQADDLDFDRGSPGPMSAAGSAAMSGAGSAAMSGAGTAAMSGASSAAFVESVQQRKTAALFRAAVVGGARLAGGDEASLARLGRFADAAGVAFQIADDLLDDPGDGEAGDGASLVDLLGAPAARARAEALLEEALAALEPFGARAEPLRELARFAVWRDR